MRKINFVDDLDYYSIYGHVTRLAAVTNDNIKMWRLYFIVRHKNSA